MPVFAWLYASQVLVAGAALWNVVASAREVFVRAPLDAPVFLKALEPLLLSHNRGRAISLCSRLMPAYCAELAGGALLASESGQSAERTISMLMEDLRGRARASLDTMTALARLAPPLAFAVALVSLSLAKSGDAGLLALQRGLVESLALSQAVLAVVTGMATSFTCRVCATLIAGRARGLNADLDATARMFMAREES